ncbi:ABC transporter substrate-binding protein [Spongiactinospora sp. TRM90649]|uniref:ABC transporter substrate-binding protein n=1 Tax=Spongiactinospora sp. TRM90649 TaxID=3031114 RepID=UPI0023F97CA1|nr:ABC transporter substrate-binding protein [Spongiactinospora sp. TRM90649]MDF5753079.1 ABC transporter substrate-binding protein [Spongiactinospora sp. TRM90649]
MTDHISGRARRATAAAAGAVLLLGLTGCSGQASEQGAKVSESPAPTAGGTSGLPDLGVAQSTLSTYVGGTAKAADTSKPPVHLGFITQQGGIPSFPEALVAAEAGVKFVNEKLGGIDGRPLELVPCVVVSAQEEALNCAQKMAGDDRVKVVQLSLLTVGTASVYDTLRGRKAVVGQTPASPTDVAAKDVYQPWPGSYGIQGGIAKYVADVLKAERVAVVYDGDDPGSSFGAKSVATAFKHLGVTFKQVATQTGSADVASALVSAGALDADAVVRIASTPSCVPTARAVQQLGVKAPVIALDFCTDDSVRKANGGDLPKWTYVGQSRNVLSPGTDQQAAIYRSVMQTYAPNAKAGGLAPYAWNSIILNAKMLNRLGAEPEPTKVAEWWRGFTGPLFLGPERIDCGFLADKGLPSLCSTTVFLAEYQGGDRWKPSVEVNAESIGIAQ